MSEVKIIEPPQERLYTIQVTLTQKEARAAWHALETVEDPVLAAFDDALDKVQGDQL